MLRHDAALKFIWFTAFVLVLTAGAKFISVGGVGAILDYPDSIFKIKFRNLLLYTATLESMVAISILIRWSVFLRLSLIAWLSTSFMLYRIGIWWMNPPQPCGCLGTITDALGVAPKTADRFMLSVLVVLLTGSYSLLAFEWNKDSFKDTVSIAN